MPKTLDIQIHVPDAASDDTLRQAEARAREAAVLTLQQAGELTIREAAADLGVTYEEYLQILAARGLPATHDETDPGIMDDLRRQSILS